MEGGGTWSCSQVSWREQIVEEGVIEGGSLDADPDPPPTPSPGGQGKAGGKGFMLGRELDWGFAAGFGSSGWVLTHYTLETGRLTW